MQLDFFPSGFVRSSGTTMMPHWIIPFGGILLNLQVSSVNWTLFFPLVCPSVVMTGETVGVGVAAGEGLPHPTIKAGNIRLQTQERIDLSFFPPLR
jgi:hypothetical protein